MNNNLTRFLFLIALAHLALELSANFLPVVYPILITTMGLTYAQIGFIALVFGTGASLSQPLFGYLSDRWGPQRIAILSIFWIGLLMSLVGFTWNYISLLLVVGLGSLGSAAFHPAGASIASASSGKRRGASLSVFSVGGNLGAAFSPLLVALGIGWLGLPGTGLLLPVALIMSLLLYRQWGWARDVDKKPQSVEKTSTESQSQDQQMNGSLIGLILIMFVVMCRNWFQVSLATYLPEWMQSQGWSLAASGQILSVLLISISVGSLLGGTLSDWIGRWQVVGASLVLLGPMQWLFLQGSGWLQIGLAGLIGVLIGASFPVAIVMAQESWPRGVGMASALVLGLGWLPGGIGASFTGFMADQFSLTLGLQSLVLPPILGTLSILAYAVLSRQTSRKAIVNSGI